MKPTQLDDIDEILRMAHFLGECDYRDLARDSNGQRLSVARRLWREGVDERLLRMLWSYAQSCGNTPARLFAWWMDRPSRTIEKLNEMRANSGWTRRVLDRVTEQEKASAEPAPVISMLDRRKHS